MHTWREPQLVELQRQLANVHVIPSVAYSLRGERAGVCQLICDEQTGRPAMLAVRNSLKPGIWGKLSDPHWWLLSYGSQGLLYENAATLAQASQMALDAVEVSNEVVHPHLVDKAARSVTQTFSRFSVKSYLAADKFHGANVLKTTAHAQALANEALVACALERYRMVNSSYPHDLDKLVPTFAANLPHDPINGQPLRYKLRDDGSYLLYSIGWNEVDDDGTAPPNKSWDVAAERPADWLWGREE
jgi:hypothetical protein